MRFFIFVLKNQGCVPHIIASLCPASNGWFPVSNMTLISFYLLPPAARIYAFPVSLPWKCHKKGWQLHFIVATQVSAADNTKLSASLRILNDMQAALVSSQAAEANRACWLCLIITLSDGSCFYCAVCTGHTTRILNCLNSSCRW